MDPELVTTYQRPDGPMGLLFMTEQMNVRKGLKIFGKQSGHLSSFSFDICRTSVAATLRNQGNNVFKMLQWY